MKRLFIEYNPYFVRVALAEDGELVEFGVEHVTARSRVGNIYKGKVENVIGGMKAAFVNVGLERNGFLYLGDGEESVKVSAGDIVMCQVVKEQMGAKGARLSTDISIAGYTVVLLPTGGFRGVSRKIENDAGRARLEGLVAAKCPQNMGFIVRSAAVKASDEEILAELDSLINIWRRIEEDYRKASPGSVVFREAQLIERTIRDNFAEEVDRIVVDDPLLAERLSARMRGVEVEYYPGSRKIFRAFGLAGQIDKLADRKVMIEGGAYLVIDRTEALTVIDVNTGRFVGGKDLEDTVFRTNIAAAEEVARQLRARNISGIVIVDFIDMQSDEHRKAVVERLRECLKRDRLKTSAVSMTGLGLVELTRKRTRLSADTFMLEPCESCEGGFVVSTVHLALRIRDDIVDFSLEDPCRSIIARVHPRIIECVFRYGIMAREAAEIWRGRRVYLISDPSLPRDGLVISGSDERVLTLPAEARLVY